MKKNYLVFSVASVAIAILFFFISPISPISSSSQTLFNQMQKTYTSAQETAEFKNDADAVVKEANNEDNRATSKLAEESTTDNKELEADLASNTSDEDTSAKESTSVTQGNTALKVEAPAAATVSNTQKTAPAASVSSLLKEGVQSEEVRVLQSKLKQLGYFNCQPTGLFGSITTSAVKWLQRDNGLVADGVAGNGTLLCVDKLLSKPQAQLPSRSDSGENVLIPWFGSAENIFSINKTATIYDIASGLSFKIKRTYGYNHADCETLTSEDTRIMKNIYGGQWSWNRRAVIVLVDGKRIAASMAGMPHAGLENYKEGAYVNDRSGGYGYGYNLDAVKGNDMSGHFDVHFYGSRTHATNSVDSAHQNMVQQAATWAKTH